MSWDLIRFPNNAILLPYTLDTGLGYFIPELIVVVVGGNGLNTGYTHRGTQWYYVLFYFIFVFSF